MQRKTFFTLLGLLLAQSILSLLLSFRTEYYLVELVISAWFILVAVLFVGLAPRHTVHAYAVAVFAFIVGMAHVVYAWLFILTSWLVVMLALSCAGFLFAVSFASAYRQRSCQNIRVQEPLPSVGVARKKRVARSHQRKKRILDKELPSKTPARVVVYHDEEQKSGSARVVKRSKKESSTKKNESGVRTSSSQKKTVRKSARESVVTPRPLGRPLKKRS